MKMCYMYSDVHVLEFVKLGKNPFARNNWFYQTFAAYSLKID